MFKVLNTGNILANVPQGASTDPTSGTNPGGTTAKKGNFTLEYCFWSSVGDLGRGEVERKAQGQPGLTENKNAPVSP